MAIVVAMLTGCAADEHGATPHDPHEQAVCDSSWGTGFEGHACEFACVHEDLDSAGATCVVDGMQFGCEHTFTAPGGAVGCCARGAFGDDSGWRFTECD
jgi:hypothetical protein